MSGLAARPSASSPSGSMISVRAEGDIPSGDLGLSFANSIGPASGRVARDARSFYKADMKRLASLLILSGALALASGAYAQALGGPHAQTRLVAATRTATPGTTVNLAIIQDLQPGWHTYWRNPGDSGEAPTLSWSLPAGWRPGEIIWPAPRRLPLGPIMSYGYEDHAVMVVPMNVPSSALRRSRGQVKLHLDYLVCAQVCVPESANLSLSLPVAAGPAAPDPTAGPIIAAALAKAPRKGGLVGRVLRTKTGLSLAIAGPALSGDRFADAYFYPSDSGVIDQAATQSVQRGPSGLTLTLAAGPSLGKSAPAQLGGVLETGGSAYELSATPGPAPDGAAGLGEASRGGAQGKQGVVVATIFAFLGGLILNLMPCVFPVLSLKAAALARHGGEDASHARAQALAFLAGVIATFLGLAGALMATRAAGAAVGWGFQLQSPYIVAGLCLIMLAAALNLSGLFEIGTSLQGLGSGLATQAGLSGSFFTGVLAVVVAAPCTAPFMGPALGYALTSPWPNALAVFLALALGFAAPFTVIAFSPPLIRALPRPGAWMETFRRALAFPMYGAAAWLAWVLAQQTGPEGLARLFTAAIFIALAAWLFGRVQARRAAGGAPVLSAGIAAAASLVALGAAFGLPYAPSSDSSQSALSAGAPSQPWTPAAVDQIRAKGHPVLVNFTAAWCVTCQVNERVVFTNPRVIRAFKQSGVVYLVADWTKRDSTIAKALEAQGRDGVPLYLLYDDKGDPPRILPQLLTPDLVIHALEASGGRAKSATALATRLAPRRGDG